MSGLIVLFWFVGDGVALRYLVLFIGVMSCMYVLWDVIDDTIARKVNACKYLQPEPDPAQP